MRRRPSKTLGGNENRLLTTGPAGSLVFRDAVIREDLFVSRKVYTITGLELISTTSAAA